MMEKEVSSMLGLGNKMLVIRHKALIRHEAVYAIPSVVGRGRVGGFMILEGLGTKSGPFKTVFQQKYVL